MNVLGIIPARRNSKRCPGKNIRPLAGKPLIVWTIEAAKQSKLLTHIVCSTDDEIAMRLCIDRGVDVIVRPPELATDEATSEAVVSHVLDQIPADVVVLLQPTSPFRTAEDIDTCIQIAVSEPPRCVVSGSCITSFKPNGAVYVAPVERFRETGFGSVLQSIYIMPLNRSVDIDTEADFQLAERIVKGGVDWDG